MSFKIVFSSARTLPNSFYREPAVSCCNPRARSGANYLLMRELVDTIEEVLYQGPGLTLRVFIEGKTRCAEQDVRQIQKYRIKEFFNFFPWVPLQWPRELEGAGKGKHLPCRGTFDDSPGH